MKEYFYIKLKGEKGSRRFVELLESDIDTETFLIVSENKKITINKNNFIKEAISIEKIHLERLGLINEDKGITDIKNISVKLICFAEDYKELNFERDILIINRTVTSPGFIILDKSNSKQQNNKIADVAKKFINEEITIKQASLEINGFYTLNHLFKILKKNYNFKFNELEIIRGK